MSEADRTDKESVELANEILRDFGISFSEAETNFKTSENFRKEFIDMTNKTSDKNVAIIEELIQEYKTYNDLDGIQDLSIYVNALENILADYTRQKQINEEHQKINGELRERVKALEQEIEKINKQLDLDYVEENYIPTQVVIDKVNEINKKYEDSKDENGESPYFYPDFTIRILQKLLEGEK